MPDALPPAVAELQQAAAQLVTTLSSMEQDLQQTAAWPAPINPALRLAVAEHSRNAGLYQLSQQQLPAAHPAAGQQTLALTAVRETLASANLRLARFALGPAPGVLGAANGDLRTSHLQPLLAGAVTSAFAFTEPDDPALKTTAVWAGDQLLVSGTKSYVTGGDQADFMLVVLQVVAGGQPADAATGPAVLVVDRNSPGVVVEEVFTSLDGSSHAVIRFDQTRVPASNLLGQPGEGMPRAMGHIGEVRLLLAAEACGVMAWTLAWLEQHLHQPHPRGGTLGDREGVRLRYGELRIQAYAARSTLYRTARLVDATNADSAGSAGLGRKQTVNEGMMCKVVCTETAGTLVDHALQLAGGRALDDQHPLCQLYRKVRAWRFTEGASDVLRLNIARGRLDLAAGRI